MPMDSILVVLLATVCVLHATPALAQTVQVWSSCLPANYTPGSAYDTNLRSMLKDVVGVAVRSRDGYANDTKGDAQGQEAHGLAICYADAPPEVCRLCLDMAAGNVTLACPRAVGAAMMYNNCLLRYANASFLARPDMEQRFSFYNGHMTSAGDADRHSAALRLLMDRLAPAAAASSGRMSAFGQTNITADESLYGFAQCVEDLSPDDCCRCLQSLAASLPM